MRTIMLAVASVALLAGTAFADEQAIKLKPGAGLDKVEGNCAACHTLAYIPMNSVYLNKAGWTAEVTKMIKAYGAPIDDADAKAIVEYLSKNYGS
jgi:mono/diheme cytochrome c family protein